MKIKLVHFTDTSTFKYIQDVVGDVNKSSDERITEPFNIFKYNEVVAKDMGMFYNSICSSFSKHKENI